jgi:transcriptional regulator with XRE-family HTH domain
LRQIRREAGLGQVELARRLGKPQSFVSKYESGERRLDPLDLQEVCEAVGISLEGFAGRLDKACRQAVKPSTTQAKPERT